MPEHHILNLGAGVQSTCLYLMAMAGEFPCECAVFADTQEETDDVYEHLQWLISLGGPPIHVRTAGKLGDDLIRNVQPSMPNGVPDRPHFKHRFASIPAFTAYREGEACGIVKRQCTAEYKIQVVEKFIRRELLELQPKKHIPRDVQIHQYFGFSYDEPMRAAKARIRFETMRWGNCHFPLFEDRMTRAHCVDWLKTRVPHVVPRSACSFCPYKSNAEWKRLRDNDPKGWARAVEIDEALRKPGNIVNRGMEQSLYLHRTCRPLVQVNLHDDQLSLFGEDCEGGCGL